nr:switch 2-like isoform X1 [Ziziphus jujuba var. spinosa]
MQLWRPPYSNCECCERLVPNGTIWPYLHRGIPDGCDSCPYCIALPCPVKLQQISNHVQLIKPNLKDDPDKQKKNAEFASSVFGPDIDMVRRNMQNESFVGISDAKHCGKMRALEKLLCSWVLQGDFAFRDLMALHKPTRISLLLMTFNLSPSQRVNFQRKNRKVCTFVAR